MFTKIRQWVKDNPDSALRISIVAGVVGVVVVHRKLSGDILNQSAAINWLLDKNEEGMLVMRGPNGSFLVENAVPQKD